MQLQKHLHFILYIVYALLAAAAFLVLFKGLLPFLLAFLLSCLLEPTVCFLSDKLKFKRALAAALVLLIFTALLLLGLWFLLQRLWYEFGLLRNFFPQLFAALESLLSRFEGLLYRFSVAAPPTLQTALDNALAGADTQLNIWMSDLSSKIMTGLATAAGALPRTGLFALTTLLGSFLIISGRPALLTFLRRQIPPQWLPKLDKTVQKTKIALWNWLRAQGILIAGTFLLLGAGLLLMGIDPALLLAAGICLLDALPIFGAGMILVPWATVQLIVGDYLRGGFLLVLYAVILLFRSLLEPKLLARQTGLPPLAALLCMYMGFTLFDVPGMFLMPLFAVVLRQLHEGNIIRLWK